jgi:O-antigen/teichoic acid export membrane protein
LAAERYTDRSRTRTPTLASGTHLSPEFGETYREIDKDCFQIDEKIEIILSSNTAVGTPKAMGLGVLGFSDAVKKAFVPWLYEKLKENGPSEMLSIVAKTYLWFLIILVCGSFGSWLLAPTLTVLIAGQEYTKAGEVIGWLIMGQVLGGTYLMATNYIFYMKRTDLLGFVTISSGVINLGMLYYLIPIWGLKGAAVAFLLAMMVRFLLTWFLAFRVCPMPWFNFKKLYRVKLI